MPPRTSWRAACLHAAAPFSIYGVRRRWPTNTLTEIDRDEIGQAVGVHRETVRRIRKEMPPLFLSTGITTRWTPRLLGCGQRTLPMNSGGDSR
jgi:hypothetical protein